MNRRDGPNGPEDKTRPPFLESDFWKRNQKFAGFLFLPALVFFAVFIGVMGNGSEEDCGARGRYGGSGIDWGTEEFNGKTYSLYAFEEEDFEIIRSSWVPDGTDTSCPSFSDWELKSASEFKIQIDVYGFGEMRETCLGGANKCDIAVRQGGQDWTAVHPGETSVVGAYFAYDDRGFFENGVLIVAVQEDRDFENLEIDVNLHYNNLLLTMSFFVVPVGWLAGFVWATRNQQVEFKTAMTSVMKPLLKFTSIGGAVFFIGMVIFINIFWEW